MTRLVLAVETRLYREGLASALESCAELAVVATTSTARETLEVAPSLDADLVLLDLSMPDAMGTIARLRDVEITVVALGVSADPTDLISCARAGAIGFVSRNSSVEELIGSVQAAVRGELHCSARMARRLLDTVRCLTTAEPARTLLDGAGGRVTRRECEIVELIDRGFSNKEIAGRLHIEVSTVKNHVHNILEKTNTKRRGQAAAKLRPAIAARRA